MVLRGHEIWANADVHSSLMDDEHRNGILNPFDANAVRLIGHGMGNVGMSAGHPVNGEGIASPLTHISTNGYYGYHTLNSMNTNPDEGNNNGNTTNQTIGGGGGVGAVGAVGAATALATLHNGQLRPKKRHCVDYITNNGNGNGGNHDDNVGNLNQIENGFRAKRHCPSSDDAFWMGNTLNPVGMDVDDMLNGEGATALQPSFEQQQQQSQENINAQRTEQHQQQQQQQQQQQSAYQQQQQQQQQLYFQGHLHRANRDISRCMMSHMI